MKNSVLLKRKARYGWIFISPFLLGFLFIYTSVFINSIIFSFSKIQINDSGFSLINVGWSNYNEVLFVSNEFNKTVVGSIGQMFVNVPIILIFSLFIAVLLNQKMKGRGAFRAIFFLPVILATGIIANAEMNNAIINSMWGSTGIDTGVSSSSGLVSLMDVQKYLSNMQLSPQFTAYIVNAVNNIYNILNISGVQILIFLAGLQSISPAIYESAQMEGATGWESFWKITFPMISPLIFLNLIYSIIDSFTNPQNQLIELINTVGIGQAKFGLASSMAWIYAAITTIIVIIAMLLASKLVFYQQKR